MVKLFESVRNTERKDNNVLRGFTSKAKTLYININL